MADGDRRDRQSWFGVKKYVKDALSYPLPHAGVKLASRYVPSLRSGRLPAPRSLREVRGIVGDTSYVMLRPDRCEIAKELYWGNGRRPRPADAFAVEMMATFARHADVFFDIGAYTGVFTLVTAASNPRLHAHAFEIVPAVADMLDANLRRNGIAERVVVHRVGVGRSGDSMVIPSGSGGSALPSFYSSRMRFEQGLEVPFVSLDSFADAVPDGSSVIMKIDVEGTEGAIFEHGTAFLARHRPTILCELLHGQADPELLHRLLDPIGYRAYLVGDRSVRPRTKIVPDRTYKDWLLTVDDRDALSARGIVVA